MSTESQITTLLFAVGQLLKKVDTLKDQMTIYQDGLAQLRREIEIREAVHQVWLEDRAAALLRGNALWLQETEAPIGKPKRKIEAR